MSIKIKEASTCTVKPWQEEWERNLGRKCFVQAATQGQARKEVELWLWIIKKNQIGLSAEETWIKKIFHSDLNFSQEEFTKLSEPLKNKLYCVANTFSSEKMVKKLKPLIKSKPLLFRPDGSGFLAINMDIITLKKTLKNFFKDLRKTQALLTQEEFRKLNKTTYVNIGLEYDHIYGKMFIERVAKQNQLSHIKVSKKIIVLSNNRDTISVTIGEDLQLASKQPLDAYSEIVQPVNRKLSLEEAIEFMIFIEKAGFTELNDFGRPNYYIAKDGIYFINTKAANFSSNQARILSAMRSITNLIDTQDLPPFLKEYQRRKRIFKSTQATQKKLTKQYQSALQDPSTNLLCQYKRQKWTFTFPLYSKLNRPRAIQNPPLLGKPWQEEWERALAREHFVQAALRGDKSSVSFWLEIIETHQIALSRDELWIKKAFQNDPNFSTAKFTKLNQVLKRQIYLIASAFASEKVFKKLRPFVRVSPLLFPPMPTFLAINMDIFTTRSTIQRFLNELRKNGALLTQKEFEKLDQQAYVDKEWGFNRLQGKMFIERIAKENGLRYIKVPKKILVIDNNEDTISFTIHANLELVPKQKIRVYAEKIERVQRKLSLEEAIEFMITIEKTGFYDFAAANYFIAKDGIYFIDTEPASFSRYANLSGSMESISDLVESKDVKKFLREFQKQTEKSTREKQTKKHEKALKNPYMNLVSMYQEQEFTFSLSQVFEQQSC